MKQLLLIVLSVFCGSGMLLARPAQADSGVVKDSILSIRNLNSGTDTAGIKEIIAIKLSTSKPVSSFTTLFVDGIPLPKTRPWKVSECDKTVFFQVNREFEELVQQFLKNQSAENNIVPLFLSVGDSACTAKAADPVYMVVRQKVNAALAWVIGALLLAVALFCLYFDILKDDNNLYYSLGRTQLFYWTMLLSFAYLYVCLQTGMLPTIPASMLVILGISAGTTAVTKIVENTSKDGVPIDVRAKSDGWFMDILSDGSSINIHRFQNVVFNLIFGIIFVQRAISMNTIPDFDENVLLLLGISSGTYAGLKMTEATKVQAEPAPQVVSEAAAAASNDAPPATPPQTDQP